VLLLQCRGVFKKTRGCLDGWPIVLELEYKFRKYGKNIVIILKDMEVE
jgi:hypothetical protein